MVTGRVSWPRVAFTAVFALLIIGVVIGTHVWLRRRDPHRFGRSALWELERPERKEVVRAIRRGTDVRPELRDVAARAAHQVLFAVAGVAYLRQVKQARAAEERFRAT